MEEIKVMLKPDWITWEDIHELLLAAHKRNVEKGMTMRTPHMSPEELEARLGEDGRCFVALANNKLVGTTSVSFYRGRSWYDRGQLVAHYMLSGILPKYQGIGIDEDLGEIRSKYVHEKNVNLIHADTAENNMVIRKKAKLDGCVDVAYQAFKSDHYSVIFVKWLGECPFSEKYINRKFKMSKALTKIQYKKGRIERSRIVSFFCRVMRKIFDIA